LKGDVKDPSLAAQGTRRVLWADQDMPVLRLIRERFGREKPLAGRKMSACLHITAETANLARTLQAGGADLCLCASNPLSTQDDVAAALEHEFGIPTFAIRGEDRDTYYRHIIAAVEHEPDVTMDDGADLVSVIHSDYPRLHDKVVASMEETTTGVIRLRAMERAGALKFPVVAVNDADCKHLFDNRYGTGQSTVDGIIRASDVLMAGRTVVVAGYGWCGRGFAMRAHGLGARVVVAEVNPIRALEAVMDGYWVMPMAEAARVGDVFCTLTGDIRVLRGEHFEQMKNGAVVANSGHFNVEIDIEALEQLAARVERGVRANVDTYVLRDGRRIHLLAEGRLVNLAAAEGHPASVMDMSFAVQALATEWALQNAGRLAPAVHPVPKEIDDWVAKLKLESMGVRIDELTEEQRKYLASWEMGT
jgi:adenosylhomocysteinase